jgi:hypothetical protein
MGEKSGYISRAICLIFIQYMNIYFGIRREPERMLENMTESSARLQII